MFLFSFLINHPSFIKKNQVKLQEFNNISFNLTHDGKENIYNRVQIWYMTCSWGSKKVKINSFKILPFFLRKLRVYGSRRLSNRHLKKRVGILLQLQVSWVLLQVGRWWHVHPVFWKIIVNIVSSNLRRRSWISHHHQKCLIVGSTNA